MFQTYREAVDIYRRVVELQAKRPARFQAQRAQARVDRGEPLSQAADPLRLLTPREWEVARLIALGHTNREIADALVLTPGTVANHVGHILGKIDASNRTQIAAYYLTVSAQGATPQIANEWDDLRVSRAG